MSDLQCLINKLMKYYNNIKEQHLGLCKIQQSCSNGRVSEYQQRSNGGVNKSRKCIRIACKHIKANHRFGFRQRCHDFMAKR